MKVLNFSLISILVFIFISCEKHEVLKEKPSEHKKEIHESWLKGNNIEKNLIIEEQFGGFSKTMMEVGYRYSELYWAALDENWDYAEHQIEHIEEAMERGLVRRPERSNSAQAFLKNFIPLVYKAIESKDSTQFFESFESMRQECNSCHIRENEEYIVIEYPEIRLSPVRF